MDPTVRGHQPAGPNRWKRAEQWAKARPDSARGKKYLARVAAAEAVASQGLDRSWEHYTRDRHGDATYKGQTCSTYHAMLRLQLDLGIAGLQPLYDAVRDGDSRAFVRAKEDTRRKGACAVCGGEVEL